MVRVFNPIFDSSSLNKTKDKTITRGNNISRKCYAVVALIDNEYKAIVNYDKEAIHVKEGDEISNEQLVIPFTKESLSIKGKKYIWLKEKDKYGHNVCVIRSNPSDLHPGVDGTYDALKENLLIAGHIVRKNNKMYFEYEDLIAYHYLADSHICDINIDTDKPLFNK